MQGDEQERFEDYLELEHYIEELQAGHVVHPPANLTPSQARVYRMAALFRSLSPDAATPRPEFAEQLKAQLLAADTTIDDLSDEPTELMQAISKPIAQPIETPLPEQPPVQPPAPAVPFQPAPRPQQAVQRERKKVNFFSRRSLLASGAVAAASLAVGAAAEHLTEQTATKQQLGTSIPNTDSYAQVNIATGISTTWHPVTTLEQLGTSAVRFVTDSVVGYVVRITVDTDGTNEGVNKETSIVALSAACTHKGCIVKWQDSDRLFHCPCHDGLFDASGTFVNITQYGYDLTPLPRLNTKIAGNTIYVEVPAAH